MAPGTNSPSRPRMQWGQGASVRSLKLKPMEKVGSLHLGVVFLSSCISAFVSCNSNRVTRLLPNEMLRYVLPVVDQNGRHKLCQLFKLLIEPHLPYSQLPLHAYL